MYSNRSDAVIYVPYGDTITLNCSLDEPIKGEISAQIRDQLGEWLADFYVVNQEEKHFIIRTNELIPVGVHYMDIRFNNEGVISHTEILRVEVTDSVTHNVLEDTSGRYD